MRIRLIVTTEIWPEAAADWLVGQLQELINCHRPFSGRVMDVKWEPAPKCVRCGRELMVPQLLDHIKRPGSTVCMPCMGGS